MPRTMVLPEWVQGGTGGGATTLDGLSDVDTTGAVNGNVLTFNSGTLQWVPQTVSGVSVTSVNGNVGAVVLDAADVGAVDKTGDTMSGNLVMGTTAYISYAVQPVSDPSFVTGDVVEIYRWNFPFSGSPVLIGTTAVDGTGVISINDITSVITAYFDANGIPYFISNSPILNEIRYLTNGYSYPNDIFTFPISVPSRSYGPTYDFNQYNALVNSLNKIKNLDNGVDSKDAVNKGQLDTSVEARVSIYGDEMIGNLNMGTPYILNYAPPTYTGFMPSSIVDVYLSDPSTILPDILIGDVIADTNGDVLPSQMIAVLESYFITNNIEYSTGTVPSLFITYRQENTPASVVFYPKIGGITDTVNTVISDFPYYHKIRRLADGVDYNDAVNKGQMELAIATAVQTINTYNVINQSTNVTAASGTTYLTTGALLIQFPAPTANANITIKKTDSSTVTILPNGAEKIEGTNANYLLTSTRESAIFVSNGSDWFRI